MMNSFHFAIVYRISDIQFGCLFSFSNTAPARVREAAQRTSVHALSLLDHRIWGTVCGRHGSTPGIHAPVQ